MRVFIGMYVITTLLVCGHVNGDQESKGELSEKEKKAREYLSELGVELGYILDLHEIAIGAKETDALLSLTGEIRLNASGSKFAKGQLERLGGMRSLESVELIRTNVTADDIRAFVKKCGPRTLSVKFGYFWESPTSDWEVAKLRQEFTKVDFEHASKSDVAKWVDRQFKYRITKEPVDPLERTYGCPWDDLDEEWFYGQELTRMVDNLPTTKGLLLRAKERMEPTAVLSELQNLDGALEDLKAALKSHSTDIEKRFTRLFMGKAYLGQENFHEALPAFDAAIELGADDGDVHRDRGDVRAKLNDTAGAIADYTTAIRRFQEEAKSDKDGRTGNFAASEVFFKRGVAKEENGDAEGAIVDYTNAIAESPWEDDLVDPAYRRALIYKAMGDYQRAIADLSLVVQHANPSWPWPYLFRGECYQKTGQLDNALVDYTLCLVRTSENAAPALWARASLLEAHGATAEAIADLQRLIETAPDHATGHELLASILSECSEKHLRDGPHAVTLAEKACELTEWKDIRAICALASAHAENGDFDTAQKWAVKAIEATADSQIDATSAKERLTSFKAKKPFRRARTALKSNVLAQCRAIRQIHDAGGLTVCSYLESRRRFSVTFGDVGDRINKNMEFTITGENTSNWRLLEISSLTLSHTRIEPEALRAISLLPSLTTMRLHRCNLTDAPQLGNGAFTRLENIHLDKIHLFDEVVEAVEKMPKLSVLRYGGCTCDQVAFYSRLVSNRSLEEIDVIGNLNDDHLAAIARLPLVSRICLYNGVFSKQGVESLIHAVSDREVQIDISGNRPTLTEQDLSVFNSISPNVLIIKKY